MSTSTVLGGIVSIYRYDIERFYYHMDKELADAIEYLGWDHELVEELGKNIYQRVRYPSGGCDSREDEDFIKWAEQGVINAYY